MKISLEANIRKYFIFRIFTKRTFLPLISIYLIDHGGVSLHQLAVILSITTFVSLLLEVPAGYVADRIGHKRTLVLGSAISALSVLPYIFVPNVYGALMASVLFFSGYSFLSGTMQAFIHETLLALGRDREYSRIMGLAQSYGLLGNVVLITLVPLTYMIDPVFPFVLGFIFLSVNCVVAWSFQSPPARVPAAGRNSPKDMFKSLRAFSRKGDLPFFIVLFAIFGVASASYQNAPLYREVMFRDAGISVAYFGVILAAGSLLAALAGRYIHHLEKIRPAVFYGLDGLYLCVAYVLAGLASGPFVLIMAFMLFMGYDRTRSIIFEAEVLKELPHTGYKSTIISIMNFSTHLNALWAPLLLSFLIDKSSLGAGYMVYGAFVGIVLSVLLGLHVWLHRKTVSV